MGSIMKNKKVVSLSIAAITSLSLLFPLVTSAEEDNVIVNHEQDGNLEITTYEYPDGVEYDFEEQPTSSFSTMYVPYDGKDYSQVTKSTYKKQAWSTEIKNNSSSQDSVSRSVNRSRFSNGSVGGSTEASANFKLVTAKVGISAEKSWGKSDTVSVRYTWNIPAKKTTTIKTGSKAVKSAGTIKYYSRGKVYKTVNGNVNYSYTEYSDKTSK
ncbi:hypothetical protein, partial [Terribacillus saccharophilus]|uniref:hypothetical protein n=1 Tax=Terribacillus saccharophilus TaxID=361277 RepID=UPI002DC91186|nr:hypothetical protein [Terribacillus saccharophilus]